MTVPMHVGWRASSYVVTLFPSLTVFPFNVSSFLFSRPFCLHIVTWVRAYPHRKFCALCNTCTQGFLLAGMGVI